MAENSEGQQKDVKSDKGTEVSHRGVFLLGENRWEEPSRLFTRNGVDRSKNKDVTTKCLQCRGEGRLLCTGMQFICCISMKLSLFASMFIDHCSGRQTSQ